MMRHSPAERTYRRLPALIVAITLAAVGSGALALRYLETRMIGTAGEGLALAAAELTDKVDQLLFERYADVQVFAKTAETRLGDRRALTAYLDTTHRLYPLYVWIGVTDATGTIIAATDPASVGEDRHEQPWFQVLREGAPVYTGDVAFSGNAGQVRSIPFAAPMTDGRGRFLGAVVTHVGVSVLEDAAARTVKAFQSREGFYGHVEYLMVTGRGEVFVDSSTQGVEFANLKTLGVPSVALLSSGVPGYVVEPHRRRHVPVLTGYARTQGYGRFAGPGWGVLIRLDKRDVLSPIRKVQTTLGGAAALVFVPVLGFLFWNSARLRREQVYGEAQRARAEEAERRIREIIEHSTNVFYAHGLDHILTYASPQAKALLGCDPAEAAMRWQEFLTDHPVNQRGIELTERAIETGEAQPPYELELRTKDGRALWVEVHEAPVVRDGRTVAVVGSLTDITERKRMGEALRRSEEWFRSLIENASDLIVAHDADGTIRYTSPSVHRLLGYGPGDLIGRTIFEFVHADDRPIIGETLVQALRCPGTLKSTVTRVRTTDGRWLALEVSGQAASDMAGGMLVVVNARDITDRRRAESALQEANERLNALINSSPLGITVLNPDGGVALWNPAAGAMFGWTSEEVIGQPLPIVPPDRREEHRVLRERVLRGEGFSGVELVRLTKSGSPITISLSAAPLRDQSGTIVGILGMMADVTKAKQMEHHSRQMEHLALLGQLIGGIAHEIKNPLFVETGYLQMAKEDLAKGNADALRRDLGHIDDASRRIAQTVQRFLALARPSPPTIASCGVHAILKETLAFLEHECLIKQVAVEVALQPDLPVIKSNERLLQEVFLNLMVNAIQAMHSAYRKGTLTVAARVVAATGEEETRGHGDAMQERRGDAETGGRGEKEISAPGAEGAWIEVRIQDDGPGIAPEHRDRLFEPFFTTKPVGIGTGLGLWTVRTNLASLGGTVICESEPGQGTTFIVRLPVAVEPAQG